MDISPKNILIHAYKRKLYLIDFGFAVEQPGAPRGGTRHYMAPELYMDSENCTSACDMWSVGIVYFMNG
jgi:serine/threonine protein kinase